MANSDDPWENPWEPPLAGTEAEHLVGALDRLRTTVRWKADDLDAAGLQTRIGASSLTLGGLLKHLAAACSRNSGEYLLGRPIRTPFSGAISQAQGVHQSGSTPRPPTRRHRLGMGWWLGRAARQRGVR